MSIEISLRGEVTKLKISKLIPIFTISVIGRYGFGMTIGVIFGIGDLSTFEFAMVCVLTLLIIADWVFTVFSLWGGDDEAIN